MRNIIISFLFFLSPKLFSQVSPQPAAGNTYAVIVGISKYQTESLTLDFADRDAVEFANYLKSKAGGSVKEENIQLLLNDNATYSAIYDALDKLLNTCQKDDLVYFYFSGHGDMEHQTIYQTGFLLSYNTPKYNYINSAVRIDDLNNIANTLSITNKAKVIMITDACHSGKLASTDYKGTNFVIEQLRAVQLNEIRITSCTANQLSAEDQGWGGGRGVFSYYLVQALRGKADDQKDGIVTLAELRSFLQSSLAKDPLLARKEIIQTPVLKGADNFKLAVVDPAETIVSSSPAPPITQTTMPGLKPLRVQPQAAFFHIFEKIDPVHALAFDQLVKLPKEQVAAAVLKMIADSVNRIKDLSWIDIVDSGVAFNENAKALLGQLAVDSNSIASFNNRLAVLLSDSAQQVINNYLEGDAAELEKRRYYNASNNGYAVYPKIFELARKINSDKYLQLILETKQCYFSGVAIRLRLPLVAEALQPKLIDEALVWQKRAFDLEPNAAYIENELGVLYLLKNDFKNAEPHLVRATQIAPAWAIPWSNLANMLGREKKYKAAIDATEKAKELQADLPGIYVNSGMIHQEMGNLLVAEEMLHKSIELNSRDYLPFERSAYLYMNTTRYQVADSFFYEADVRKKGLHVMPWLSVFDKVVFPKFDPEKPGCDFDTNHVADNDPAGHLVWGMLSEQMGNNKGAEKHYKKTIALDPNNPLAFHYLGRLLYFQERWQEAEIILNLAAKKWLPGKKFKVYAAGLATRVRESLSKPCILENFERYYYREIEDHYFLGSLYEKWNHYSESEDHYRKIISLDSSEIYGYALLWRLQEKAGHYKDAESTIKNFINSNNKRGVAELAEFYRRMTDRFPLSGEWNYTAGVFLYDLAMNDPARYTQDVKFITPDEKLERYRPLGQSVEDGVMTVVDFSVKQLPPYYIPYILQQRRSAVPVYFPRTEAIEYLKKADSLLQQDEDVVADINYKIGDLYVGQELFGKAGPFYKRAVDIKPNDANARMKLAFTYDITYSFTAAQEQLDSLYQHRELNFDNQLKLAEYAIHAGKFDRAAELLAAAQGIHPFRLTAIADLNGRLQLMLKNYAAAIGFYKTVLVEKTADAGTMYTIASLYARLGQKPEAIRWLEQAINKGFDLSWVLQFDEAFNGMRNSGNWNALIKRMKPRTYVNTVTGQ